MMFVELAGNENKVIELKKISVPKVDGTYKVELFADITAADEYNKRLQDLWGHGYDYQAGDGTDGHGGGAIPMWSLPRDQANVLCLHTKNGKWKGVGAVACSAWTGANYLSLGKGAVKTDKEANLWMVDFEFYFVDTKDRIITSVQPLPEKTKFVNYGHRVLGNGNDGDFFSVLPGTYGLEFTSLTGKVSKQTGIVID